MSAAMDGFWATTGIMPMTLAVVSAPQRNHNADRRMKAAPGRLDAAGRRRTHENQLVMFMGDMLHFVHAGVYHSLRWISGIAGLRVNHDPNVQVADFGVT
jgi:hypothetical protein